MLHPGMAGQEFEMASRNVSEFATRCVRFMILVTNEQHFPPGMAIANAAVMLQAVKK